MDIFSNIIFTHILMYLLGIPTGIILDRLLLKNTKRENVSLNIKALFVTVIHIFILTIYLGILLHSQFFGGQIPSIIFSGFAAVSFGSLVGERDRIVELIQAFRK